MMMMEKQWERTAFDSTRNANVKGNNKPTDFLTPLSRCPPSGCLGRLSAISSAVPSQNCEYRSLSVTQWLGEVRTGSGLLFPVSDATVRAPLVSLATVLRVLISPAAVTVRCRLQLFC